ncbi:MAG TPA: CRTAC1 family protein [Blastocatellia bacterium]|nr:CRTAC1 family protein [Blastocatellia bacterium]
MRRRRFAGTSGFRVIPVLVLWVSPSSGYYPAQTKSSTSAQSNQQSMGVSTGAPRVYGSRRTAGVVVENAPVVFEDVTAKTELAKFKHRSGTLEKNYILEAVSGGVAVLDYDNDGLPDIYILNGSTFDALRGKERPPRAALYHNLGNWKFEDVTEKAGVSNERWGMGVAVGDYDNDGWPDMYVSNYGVSRLYHNNRDGTFTDVAVKLGVARKGWSTGATFGDYDGDGRLDLFVPGYVEFDIDRLPPSPAELGTPSAAGKIFCQFRGVPVMCGPRGLVGETDSLFHQKADGTFEDVSVKAGVNDPERFYGFSSAFVHIDEDKLIDLIVVNDSSLKLLYINKGNGTFEETGIASGVAVSYDGRAQAGMGLGVGDYDNDGRVDFYITNFSDDYNTLLRNEGGGTFSDVSFQSAPGELTLPFLGWGASFLDYDNDGWKDLLVANGHVYPCVENRDWGTSYAEQPLLLRNKSGKFERVGAAPGSGLALALPSRGMAVADLDGDGLLDAVINNIDSAPTLLRNVTKPAGHWIELKLIGDPGKKSPRDAIGAIVYVTAGKLRQRQDVVSGAGYASQNDLRLHFGLGQATIIDRVEIVWPGGDVESVTLPSCDKVYTITQGQGVSSK